MEILRRLRKVVHKDTVTAFQMSHVRLIFITTRRNQLIEKNNSLDYMLDDNDTLVLNFKTVWNNMTIHKKITFYGN